MHIYTFVQLVNFQGLKILQIGVKVYLMAPLFVVQETPDCNIPEEMKIYEEKTGKKTVNGTKKLLGVMKAKRS